MSMIAAVVVTAAILLLPAASALAGGGVGTPTAADGQGRQGEAPSTARRSRPTGAPKRVVRAIKAANHIRKTKYVWGGGHGSFESRGYDCSGAVSYMLHGAGMLKAPLDSGSLEHWGKKKKGKWITVYANSGHTYAMVAGLRWDTSGGPGPRWHKDKASRAGFKVRHYKGY